MPFVRDKGEVSYCLRLSQFIRELVEGRMLGDEGWLKSCLVPLSHDQKAFSE